MATVSTKRQRTEKSMKSMKVKYEALKELEKGVPHNDVAARFGVPKNTLYPHGRKTKLKLLNLMKVARGLKE